VTLPRETLRAAVTHTQMQSLWGGRQCPQELPDPKHCLPAAGLGAPFRPQGPD
jgi:hypothetical protein